jgi:membrane associated rhomboid family serine protease
MELSLSSILLGVTVLVSLTAFSDNRLFEALLFDPHAARTRNDWYRFISHALVHADVPHLLVNMFVLVSFGQHVELLFSRLSTMPVWLTFGGLYVGGAVVAAIPAYVKHGQHPGYRSVGASGAVSALIFALVLLLPMAPLRILLVPIDLPAFVFGLLYLVYAWAMDRRGGDHVAHDAHLHGALFGLIFTAVLEPQAVLQFGGLEPYLMP